MANKKRTQVATDLPKAVRKTLERAARKQDRSLAHYVRRHLIVLANRLDAGQREQPQA